VGEKTGPSPVDRAKSGTKRSLLTEAAGIPLALAVGPANRNDFKLARETLERIELERPVPTRTEPQGMCMDKNYDRSEIYALLEEFRFTAHIRARGEEAQTLKRNARTTARRWVVERSHSWLNRFRAILIRWNKKAQNYLGFLHLALGIITWRQITLLR
jgi:putative transposase